MMKVAIASLNGEVFEHFGKCPEFRLFEINESKYEEIDLIVACGKGHGALVDLLLQHNVNVLICGGIGEGARNLLKANNITLYPGVKGNVIEVIEAFCNNNLIINEDSLCNHHHDDNCKNNHGHCN